MILCNWSYNFDNYPPPGYLPVDYITPPDGGTAVPMMGTHWIPLSFAPPFTNILLYGTYDGEVTFVEPMNTLAYINSGVPFSEAYSQPTKFAKTGYYPTEIAKKKEDWPYSIDKPHI